MLTDKEKIKMLRAKVKALKEENAELREAIGHGKLYDDIEQASNGEEFDIHCIKFNFTADGFYRMSGMFKELMTHFKLPEDSQKTLMQITDEWVSDAINSRKIVEHLKKEDTLI